ncbi:unnamed protein product [Rhizophagus irregularis]|nr:unnamed protein product [Rhizophagus irregularis]
MQNNENIDKSIYWIEDAINRKHIKYYEFEILKIFKRLELDLLESITLKEIINEFKLQREIDFNDNTFVELQNLNQVFVNI